jgi:hypothetical protein
LITAASNVPPLTRTLRDNTMLESEMSASSVVPPPMSMIMLPAASCTGSPTPMAAAIGSSMRWTSLASAARAACLKACFSISPMPMDTA